jgi:S1-C subfamily serine protease
LVNPIAQTPIGQTVHLRYVRNKQPIEAALTVADREKIFPPSAQGTEERPGQSEEPSQFGLHVEELTPDIAQKLEVGKVTGVVITEVDPASFAEDTGFSRGDVITEINHTPVNSMTEYREQMSKLKPGQDVLFKIARPTENERVLTLFLAGSIPPPDSR